MASERDKGYAWMVAASSSLIMFIGPSTIASYGSIVESVDMSYNYRSWILNTTCILMFGTALTIGPLAQLGCTYRKIALVGCLLTACGFLLTSTVLQHPSWMFLTFSTFIGIGFGLAIHATFLLVALHFTRYRGLANGIGLVSAGAGYLLSPLMYEPVSQTKDKLHLRALVSAVAFMAASFYISPPPLLENISFPDVLRRHSRPNAPSNNSGNEDNTVRHEEFPRESIPLVIKDGDEAPPSHLLRPRRPSQFMIAIAGTLLPNIPEESESQLQTSEASKPNLLAPVPPAPLKEETNKDVGKHMPHLDLEVKLSQAIDKTDASEKQSKVVGNPTFTKKVKTFPGMKTANPAKFKNVAEKKLGYSQFRRSALQKDPKKNTMAKSGQSVNASSSSLSSLQSNSAGAKKNEKPLSNFLNFWLLTDPTFLNMAFGCSITMIVFPNFPIILYAHVVHTQEGEGVSDKINALGNDGGEFVLTIVFLLDLLSRLIVSYMSDFAFFNRRLGFLFGALSGAIVIASVGYAQDMQMIYILAIIYGISSGILASTESLMFADIFGISQLASAYGIVGAFKAVMTLLLSAAVKSPFSSDIYTVHPILRSESKENASVCADCDPFDLFPTTESQDGTSHHRQHLFALTAIPGFLCFIMWSMEILVVNFRKKKCQAMKKSNQDSVSSPQV